MRTWQTAIWAAAMSASAAAADDPGRAEAFGRLESRKISVDFRDATLGQAIEYLREATGLNFALGPRAAEKAAEKVTLKVRDLSARAVLRHLLRPHDLVAVWKEGALLITDRGEAGAAVVVRLYDVRAHLVRVRDFSGPKMELASPDSPNPLGVKVDIDPEPKAPLVDENLLVDLVQEATGRGAWEGNPQVSILLANGLLVVSQTPSVHREISRFLSRLLQYR